MIGKFTGRDAKVAGGTFIAVLVGQKLISKAKDFGFFGGNTEEEEDEGEEYEEHEEKAITPRITRKATGTNGTTGN